MPTAEQTNDSANSNKEDEEDIDSILAELEAESEDVNSEAYQQRVRTLQEATGSKTSGAATGLRSAHSQQYVRLLRSDDETLHFTTEHERAVVHFRHPDFARCSIMDEHLERIAQRHSYGETGGEEAAFAKVDVTLAPFVVEKLAVRVLPCVMGFVKGVMKGKVVGFEGICWDGKEKDARVSKALEDALFLWGVLKQKMLMDEHDTDSDDENVDDDGKRSGVNARRGIRGPKQNVVDEDDDWD
ncbi:hypothetical protein LTR05_001022 [Lithohypha guttulata]|uniref:Uncharacterized protein n=1 Tax=Lithohypha guttulata TaxID=1690604 RepID=A0AAN7T797_9EURO|nr:hypothetical protein LTR05_001022 [Lithohypha guttulata]